MRDTVQELEYETNLKPDWKVVYIGIFFQAFLKGYLASITSSATLDKYDVGQKRLETKGLTHQRTGTISPDSRKWPTL